MSYFLRALSALLFFCPLLLNAQSLEPFSSCPGVSVAITRPGLNAATGPYQIYLIDSAGGITPSGNPINLRINGFGLNDADGFLYGIHESSNVANPFLGRVDKNGNYENVGRLTGPPTDQFHVSIVNTAAGTCDDKGDFYFLAVTINLQDITELPVLYVGKVPYLSLLKQSDQPLSIQFTQINPDAFLTALLSKPRNLLSGAFQDIAYDPANGYIYTYFREPGTAPTSGLLAYFNPADNPTFTVRTAATPNVPTNDLSGMYFGNLDSLYILTTDGKLYTGNIYTGVITPVAQTALPLADGNLRGDMASCVGKKPLIPFTDCPGVSVAVIRTGDETKHYPFQLFTIDTAGNVAASGNLIPLQINGFGLNSQDGFLYALHETGNVLDPWFSRVDRFGSFVNIGKLTPPAVTGTNVAAINTAAGTMDGNDNFYFMAATMDNANPSAAPQLYLGTITNVSRLNVGDSIPITYKAVSIGSGVPGGLGAALAQLQDISFDPVDHQIYTTFTTSTTAPGPMEIGRFDPTSGNPVLNGVIPANTNPAIANMCGLFNGNAGALFILTTDGKFYKGDPATGEIGLITQTGLPLLGFNLRGDLASCVPATSTTNNPTVTGNDQDRDNDMRVAPNPVQSGQVIVSVNSQGNEHGRLQVVGPTGSPLETKNVQLSTGSNQFQLDVSQLREGIYSVILYLESGRIVTRKLVRL